MVPYVRLAVEKNQIATLSLNRPETRNALNWEMMEAFSEIVEALTREKDLLALIVTGVGDAFCAGGDLFELHNFTHQADGERLAALMGNALIGLANLPIPVIAAIEGSAIGGGAEIILSCDIRIASQTARIGFPQITLALTPAWGGAGHLVKMIGYPAAFALLSSGEILDSQKAFDLGLIQRIVPAGQALAAASETAHNLIASPPAAMHALKAILRAHAHPDPTGAQELERKLFAKLWASDEHVERSARFIQSKAT